MNYYWNGNDNVFHYRDHHIRALKTFSYQKDYSPVKNLTMHYHKGCMEFVVVLSGTYNILVEEESYTAEKGGIFVVGHDQAHGLATPVSQTGELIDFIIDITDPKDFLGLSIKQAEPLIQKLDDIDMHMVECEAAADLVMSTYEHLQQLDDENNAIAQSTLVIFLYKILQAADYPGKMSRSIRDAVKYINQHISEDIDLETLSRACGLSMSYFKHKFKSEMNITPKEYVNQKKIEMAKELLLSNSVGDVAKMLSFTTSNYFAVVFKKITGLTPSEYRAQNHSGDVREL